MKRIRIEADRLRQGRRRDAPRVAHEGDGARRPHFREGRTVSQGQPDFPMTRKNGTPSSAGSPRPRCRRRPSSRSSRSRALDASRDIAALATLLRAATDDGRPESRRQSSSCAAWPDFRDPQWNTIRHVPETSHPGRRPAPGRDRCIKPSQSRFRREASRFRTAHRRAGPAHFQRDDAGAAVDSLDRGEPSARAFAASTLLTAACGLRRGLAPATTPTSCRPATVPARFPDLGAVAGFGPCRCWPFFPD